MPNVKTLIDTLEKERILKKEEFIYLLEHYSSEDASYLAEKARNISKKHFGNKVYTRGLIEVSNYCKNDCYYCGIRRSNKNITRYRLTKEEILSCCEQGY
ncbi:MAG: [FeFe] hydrogenase H-cluster radical maturase HydE, partial [Anaerocolumna sp.]|nr:[FeFe] hydrogenase H-cluster radical maturase HydE [Anaerocolumna sp.]